MKWEKPICSRTMVKNAGSALKGEYLSHDKYIKSIEVLSNWRLIHAYPMHAINISLRHKTRDIDKNGYTVQRLKRLPSIIKKLHYQKEMNLLTMQDIGGCRSVVETTRKAEILVKKLLKSRTNNEVCKVDNYIDKPSKTGYRAIHIVYKYNGTKKEYKNLLIEVQVRSAIQHAWATAVEVVGLFTGQALKSNIGSQKWLDYFKYVSAEFSKYENRNVQEELINIDTYLEMNKLHNELNVLERLSRYTITTNYISKQLKNKTGYFILVLNQKNNEVIITKFNKSQLMDAYKIYLEREKEYSNNKNYDVVLVSANSINELKKGYKNYFADTRQFIQYLAKIHEKKIRDLKIQLKYLESKGN